jgi:predicted ribosomally synthesized peptide with nif11-like leader
MSLENAKRFIDAASQDPALQKELSAAREPAEAVRLAVQAGSERALPFTAEEFMEVLGPPPSGGEIGDDQLASIAGGNTLSPSQAAQAQVAPPSRPPSEQRFHDWLYSRRT